jgi:hypothetical protein
LKNVRGLLLLEEDVLAVKDAGENEGNQSIESRVFTVPYPLYPVPCFN